MKISSRVFIIFVFLVNVIYAKTIEQTTLQSLMNYSGIKKQNESIPGMIEMGIIQETKNIMKETEQYSLIENAKIAFNSDDINSYVEEHLKNTISNEDALLLLKWLKSDLGKKITKVEEYVSTPEGYSKMISQSKELFKNKQRLQLIQEIDKVAKLSDFSINFAIKSGVSVTSALILSDNPNKKLDTKKLEDTITTYFEKHRNTFIEMTWMSLLFCYQDINVNDLHKYINFIKQSYTQNLYKEVFNALNISFAKSIDKMSVLWAATYQKNKDSSILK